MEKGVKRKREKETNKQKKVSSWILIGSPQEKSHIQASFTLVRNIRHQTKSTKLARGSRQDTVNRKDNQVKTVINKQIF